MLGSYSVQGTEKKGSCVPGGEKKRGRDGQCCYAAVLKEEVCMLQNTVLMSENLSCPTGWRGRDTLIEKLLSRVSDLGDRFSYSEHLIVVTY